MSKGRLYSDEEVSKILSSAVKPIASAGLPAGRSSGVSLEEIEAIASEAGIDPARVRAAARTLGTEDGPAERVALLGPRTKLVLEGTVEGDVPPDRFGEVVAAIRRQYRGRGKADVVGDWLEWNSDASMVHATVRSDGDDTKLQLVSDAGGWAVASYGVSMLAAVLTIAGLGDAGTLTLANGLLVSGSAFAIARGLWEYLGGRARDRAREVFAAVMDELATIARSETPDATRLPGGSDESGPASPLS
ncbi:MAG: hypothetical protein R3195_02225 [Gemmatimonadota bacterium]|nr:hypothetical protein [Gemmatimonadota bacterium]